MLSTTGGNLVAVGFALMLAGLYTHQLDPYCPGLALWGPGRLCHLCIGADPGPAGTAAPQRQTWRNGGIWWIGTAASTAAGITLIVFGLVAVEDPRRSDPGGAPCGWRIQPEFARCWLRHWKHNSDRISQLTNVAFWLALGLISAWLFRRNRDVQYAA